jgi:glucose/arabinose dehydrogenase
MKLKKYLVIIVVCFAILYLVGDFQKFLFKPTISMLKEGLIREDVEVVAQNLEIPWSIVFLEEDILVTERTGNLVKIGGQKIKVEGVEHVGEGGLLGAVLHPNFKENRYIYLYLTSKGSEGLTTRVERFKYDDELSEKKTIISGIPGAAYHDGGRMAFKEGYLYITTGDAGNADLAQDINTLAGKVLRIKDDGSIPKDNPFGNEVYSYGHRNSQGITWDSQGRLWSTEHGRSGIKTGMDEINLIEKGKNHGWPEIEGDMEKDNMISPAVHSGARETWAPASAVYHNGSIFFGGLRGESLYEYDIDKSKVRAHFRGKFGRIRDVAVKGEYMYFTTSNTDGRGTMREGDDKLLRVKFSTIKNSVTTE